MNMRLRGLGVVAWQTGQILEKDGCAAAEVRRKGPVELNT